MVSCSCCCCCCCSDGWGGGCDASDDAMVGSDMGAISWFTLNGENDGVEDETQSCRLFKLCVSGLECLCVPCVCDGSTGGAAKKVLHIFYISIRSFQSDRDANCSATLRHVVRARRQRFARVRSAKAARLDCSGRISISLFCMVFSSEWQSSFNSARASVSSERPVCALRTHVLLICIPTHDRPPPSRARPRARRAAR